MPDRVSPFSLDQIGYGTVRFSSTGRFETHKDRMVDPYAETRIPKEAQVESIRFSPQQIEGGKMDKGRFPAIVMLHERWGLISQIKDMAKRLACEGYVVLVPNLYGRQGGMVTANSEVANALMDRLNEQTALQDMNACCEFLNTNIPEDPLLEFTKRNAHAVVGFGLGATLAIRFACQRKRLRAAVAFYGKLPNPLDSIQKLYCPLLYHAAETDESVEPNELEGLSQNAKEHQKSVEIRTYSGTVHGFCNETRTGTYHPEAANQAWEDTLSFLHKHLQF